MADTKSKTNEPEKEPVSFTDTNAETGMTGGTKGTSTAMKDLIGGLKKKREEEEKKAASSTKDEEGGKKKKKKKGKGKTKKKRGQDRYEPQNYLLRIEGTICCASLVLIVVWILLTAVILTVIIIATSGDINHLMFKNKIDYSKP